jgi:hypothetical protein
MAKGLLVKSSDSLLYFLQFLPHLLPQSKVEITICTEDRDIDKQHRVYYIETKSFISCSQQKSRYEAFKA